MADRRLTLSYDLARDDNPVPQTGVFTHMMVYDSNPPRWWQFWRKRWLHTMRHGPVNIVVPIVPNPMKETDVCAVGEDSFVFTLSE